MDVNHNRLGGRPLLVWMVPMGVQHIISLIFIQICEKEGNINCSEIDQSEILGIYFIDLRSAPWKKMDLSVKRRTYQ